MLNQHPFQLPWARKHGRRASRVATSSHSNSFHQDSSPWMIRFCILVISELIGSFFSSAQFITKIYFRHGRGFPEIFFKLGKSIRYKSWSLTNGSRCFVTSWPSPSLLRCIISSSAEQSNITRKSKFGTKMSQVKSFSLWQCSILTRPSFWK